jgi:hypothetical protein
MQSPTDHDQGAARCLGLTPRAIDTTDRSSPASRAPIADLNAIRCHRTLKIATDLPVALAPPADDNKRVGS